jgi:outer membrane immunogenic protein
MKKLLLAISTVAAFTGSAFAADMAVKAPPMAPPPPPPPTFTGCWLSGGVGYGLFDQENTFFANDGPGTPVTEILGTTTTGGKGWLGRVGGGCDYQFSGFGGFGQGFVIGGFADYDWTNIRGTQSIVGFDFANENLRNQWAVGGRIGWVPLPGLLTFVSGGYTQAHFDGAEVFDNEFPFVGTPITPAVFRDGATYKGWFIGGGEEYAFNWLPVPGLFWKTEYRLSEFDRQNVFFVQPGAPAGDIAFNTSRKWVQTVTTSLVWRFNFLGGGYGAPVAARY